MKICNKTLKDAQIYCETYRYRFTEPRKKVLEALLKHRKPLGAYDILSLLTTENYKPNPPTIYRAVDFWIEHGFIHKVLSLNYYVACTHLHKDKQISFLVCDKCEMVQEVHPRARNSDFDTNLGDFKTRSIITELHGLCGECA